MGESLEQLKVRMGHIADLGHLSSLASWDQQTMMPARGAEARAEALATLSRIRHEMFTDDETGALVAAAGAEGAGDDPDGDDARLVALVGRRWEKNRRVPPELAAERARAASAGQEAWVEARRRSDFTGFTPFLKRNIDLARRYVECQMPSGDYECGYDVLLDDFEPLMRSADISRLFATMRAEIKRLIAALGDRDGDTGADVPLDAPFPVEAQRTLVREVLEMMGFEPAGWRMDDTVHPFAARIGIGDVRLTTRWDERWFAMGLYGAMHECGHGLYENGIPARLRRLPTGNPDSLALHESQSRLWENMVGRGRPFCHVLAPRIAQLAGGELAGVDPETFYRSVNRVRPSFIRVEADETTYGLHIALRFELERDLIDGSLTVEQLPAAWNERFYESFGLEVRDDADGVLQDVHWSAGLIGYFPTYALGNLIAGQLWERANADLPGLDEDLGKGELTALRQWLGEHVHRHGAKFPTPELLEREVGGPISVGPFLDYLRGKLGDVYGVDLTRDSEPTSER